MISKKVLPDFLLFENLNPKFAKGDTVTHKITGEDYVVVFHPVQDRIRLEHNGHPAYGYKAVHGDDSVWFRSVFEMDDGRFVRVSV